jgi:hypothetical protein
LNISENEIEKVFFISNHLHKRKIKLALDDLKAADKWYEYLQFIFFGIYYSHLLFQVNTRKLEC